MRESTKQTLAILITTVLLAATIFVFFQLVKPQIFALKDKIAEINNKKEAINQLKEYQAKSEAVLQNYENIVIQIENINQALPSSSNQAEILAVLDVISRSKQMRLNSISFKETKESAVFSENEGLKPISEVNTLANQNAKSNNIEILTKPKALEIQLSLTGTYENFKAFLSEIEKERRLLDTQTITFQNANLASSASALKGKKPAVSNIFNFDLTLYAYFQPIK